MVTVDVRRIKEIMGGLDITNPILARMIGVTRPTIKAYFDDPSKLTHDKIVKISAALNLSDREAFDIFFSNKLT